MPNKFKSPYATSFTTGCKNGTPAWNVVWNICKKTGKPTSTIWASLYKAGLCYRQKINGTWTYWPSFGVKKTTTGCNTAQANLWQCYIDWCVCNGWCSPNQLNNWTGNQKQFMNFCRNYFGKQYTGTKTKSVRRTPSSTRWTAKHTRKNKTGRNTKPGTSWTTNGTTRNYKFPTIKSRTTTTRRYVRAA